MAECAAPPPTLFTSLVVWFGLSLAAAGGAGCHAWARRKRRAGPRDDAGAPLPPRRGSVLLDADGGWAAGAPADDAARESWAIPAKELRFGRRLGAGNVGEVFRGAFRLRPVAIKKLLPAWAHDAGMVARFREEILLMAGMNHPNVLGFVGAVFDADAGNVCLVTELCERGTLAELLHSDEPLSWHRRLRLARDVAMGMDYLHTRAGIIQRDLKSSNLLVTRGYEIRVADFGLSRTIAVGAMGTYCGTPATMAPEVVRQQPYCEKADVFSFAIIMWELLTRGAPYAGRDGLALAFAVANEGLRPPVPAYCPAEWGALMVRAWADDPAARPAFDEVQRELLRLIRLLEAPPPAPAACGGDDGGGETGDGAAAARAGSHLGRLGAPVAVPSGSVGAQ